MFVSPESKILSPAKIRSFFQEKDGNTNTIEEESSSDALPGILQKKRDEIFNPDLKKLVDRVKSPQNATNLTLSKSIFEKEWNSLVPPEKKQEQILLESVYMPVKKIRDSHIMDYTSYILERIGIRTFSWHFFAYDSNAYFSEMSSGIDIVTKKNFLFLKSDPFIKRLHSQFFELDMTPEIRNNPFFKKKLSSESMSLYSKIYFFFLDEPFVDACLVAFIEKTSLDSDSTGDGSNSLIREKWLKRIGDKIHSLSPALKRYREEKLQPRFSKDDMLTEILHHFKTMIGHGMKEFFVTKIQIIPRSHISQNYFLEKQFISQILSHLNQNEKILQIKMNVFLIFSSASIQEKCKEISENDELEIVLNESQYPKLGENLLVYI